MFNLFVNIVKLEMSTRKYAFGYEFFFLKKEKLIKSEMNKFTIMFIMRQHEIFFFGETTRFVEESFRIEYFLYIVDKIISSIKNRFEQLTY